MYTEYTICTVYMKYIFKKFLPILDYLLIRQWIFHVIKWVIFAFKGWKLCSIIYIKKISTILSHDFFIYYYFKIFPIKYVLFWNSAQNRFVERIDLSHCIQIYINNTLKLLVFIYVIHLRDIHEVRGSPHFYYYYYYNVYYYYYYLVIGFYFFP